MFLNTPKTRDGTAEDSIPSVPNPEGGCRNTMIPNSKRRGEISQNKMLNPNL